MDEQKVEKNTKKVPFPYQYLVLVAMVILPALGFYLGMKVQPQISVSKDTTVNMPTKTQNPQKRDEQQRVNEINIIKQFMGKSADYKKAYPSVAFKCYDKDSLPTDERTGIIVENISQENRTIEILCLKNTDSQRIVASIIQEPKGWDPKYQQKLQVEIYTFNKDNTYGTEFLLSEAEGLGDKFKMVDWLSNDDIIYSLLGFNSGRIKTYVKNLDNKVYYDPTLIEYCTYDIAKGTSERFFSNCKRFAAEKKSLYIKQEDLP